MAEVCLSVTFDVLFASLKSSNDAHWKHLKSSFSFSGLEVSDMSVDRGVAKVVRSDPVLFESDISLPITT